MLEKAIDGEDGGGIATALGIRARGVLSDIRPFDGEGDPSPTNPFNPGLGVLKGEPILLTGDIVGAEDFRVGLSDPKDLLPTPGTGTGTSRGVSWWAFMPTYFDAREPGVIFVSDIVVVDVIFGVTITGRGYARPFDLAPGVTLELDINGVTRPVDDAEGVTRPFDTEGVMRPDTEGVIRPLRVDATDEGRDILPSRTAGEESLLKATNTPQFGGHEKYWILAQ
jgi:hypothetical protein